MIKLFKKTFVIFVSFVMMMSIFSTHPMSYFTALKTNAASPSMEVALQWAVNIANDQSHGYSQQLRDGNPDYDCSSLVYYALKNGGFTLKNSKGTILTYAFDTSSMHNWLTNSGFTYITMSSLGNSANVRRGDILWKSGHTEMYLGSGKQVGAHGNQPQKYSPNRSPEPGDQADEISVSNFNFNNWEGVFRYNGYIPDPEPDPIPTLELVTPIISTDKSSYNVGDTVYISWAASPSGSNLSHYWLNVIAPDGTWIHGGTMNKETSYSFVASQSGDYSITTYATPKGSLEGEGSLTDAKIIYVNSSEPKFYMSNNRVDIDMDNSTQHYVRFSYSDYDGPITISYEHGTRTFTQLEWGEWENNSIKLYVSGFQSGDEIITVKFKNSNTSEVLKTFTFIASMTGTLRASPEKQIYYLDLDNPQPVDVIFRVMSTPSSGYLHLESWSDENGYYYADDDVYAGGIKAIPSIYREGDAVYVKYTVTPKKIGKYPLNLMWEENDGTRWWIGQTEAIVKGDPKFSVNKNNIVLNLDKSETETIHFKYTKDFLWNHQNIQVKRNGEKITNLKWGQWQDHEIDLTLSGYSPGKETITFELYDTETKEVLATQNVVVEVTGTTKLLVSDSNVKLNMDKNEECSVVFTPTAIPVTTKNFNINVVRNGTKATNLKWGSWNNNIIELTLSGYRPGKETITFELYDTETKEVLAIQNVVVEVTGTTNLLVSDGNVKLNIDKNEECSVVFTAIATPVTTKSFNIHVVRNGAKATNLKWGAWNNNIIELTLSGYRPGKETITFELYDTETKEVLATQDVIVEVLGEIKGDCNADGEFSISDVVVLQKWLLADPSAKLNNWKAADLCEDDRLDVFDICMMKRMLIENS